MKIFVIVGMPASGKNIARMYAESKGWMYYATGDIVRAEAEKRGATDPVSTAKISDELRGADGMGVTRLALEKLLQTGAEIGFLEGMRSWPEIELIRAKAQCVVVAFVAPRKIRFERVCSRGRADDAPQAFDERDRREIAYGTAVPIALADAYVLNNTTLDDAVKQLHALVTRDLSPT
jgi:dephospho-CoA kinase